MKDLKKYDIPIDRNSSIPIYQQLCDRIVRVIQSDECQIGEYLPTENEICNLTGLSRMTVRKAFEKLNQMGLVDAVRGRGTFIVSKDLSIQRNPSIGFVLRPHRYIEEDPFYSQILVGVTQEAQKQKLHLAFVSGDRIESDEKFAEHYLMVNHLSGVIVAGQMHETFLEYVQKLQIPCVFLNYRSSRFLYDSVTADQMEIGRLLGRHLAELGRERCLYLSGEADNIAYQQRLAGFRETFACDSKRSIELMEGGRQSESGREMIRRALDRELSFTAVVGGNDMIAIGAMNELQDRGFRVPEDVCVCGIDNVSFAENCRPTLTTVHVEKQEMGVRAVKLLLNRLKNPKKMQETVLLGTELRVRQSTGSVVCETVSKQSPRATPPSRRGRAVV